MKWKDVNLFDIENAVDENEKLGAEMTTHPSTKTGQKEAYCIGGIYFQNIYEKTKFKGKNDWIFADLEGNRLEPDWFSEILNGEGKFNRIMDFRININ